MAWRTSGAGVLTVDLRAVADNWRRLAERAAPAACGAAVKADAYGLGMAQVAPALAATGCRHFFVATAAEAADLRALLPEAEVFGLGGLPEGCAEPFAALGIVPVLSHLGEIERWAGHARTLGRRLPTAVHIDTGMNRLGLGPDELDRLAAEPQRLDGLSLRLWVSHLACSEDGASPMNPAQRDRFRAALAQLPTAPASLANSSGIFRGADYLFDLVRPGAALYGVNPTPGEPNPMRGAVRLEAPILQVRNVDSPMTVGYGATHRVERGGKIATVAMGYADGFARAQSGRGVVFIGGAPAPVVGRISMDLITVDVSTLPEDAARPGQLVEVIGPNRPVDAVAAAAGTIGYEVLTGLGRRFQRVYRGAAAGVA